MSYAEQLRIEATSAAMRERIAKANQRPPPGPSRAGNLEILPFPIEQNRRFIEKELRSVRNYDDASAYKWLTNVVRRHRARLTEFGVAPAKIEADCAALIDAFGIGVEARSNDVRSRL
jgi:hypothetical protein